MSTETMTVVIGTECACESYNEDTDEFEPSESCYGDCYDDAYDYVREVADTWSKYWDTNGLRVEGRDLGWQRLSGYAERTFNDVEEFFDVFTISGDYRLVFHLSETGQLTVTRYSHDEPMGAFMSVYPVSMLD